MNPALILRVAAKGGKFSKLFRYVAKVPGYLKRANVKGVTRDLVIFLGLDFLLDKIFPEEQASSANQNGFVDSYSYDQQLDMSAPLPDVLNRVVMNVQYGKIPQITEMTDSTNNKISVPSIQVSVYGAFLSTVCAMIDAKSVDLKDLRRDKGGLTRAAIMSQMSSLMRASSSMINPDKACQLMAYYLTASDIIDSDLADASSPEILNVVDEMIDKRISESALMLDTTAGEYAKGLSYLRDEFLSFFDQNLSPVDRRLALNYINSLILD